MTPSSLPDIEEVEIVDISKLDPNRVSHYMGETESCRSVILTGGKATEVAARWRALNSAGQARCHIPSYGVRFFVSEKLMLEASVCFQCNNIYGSLNGQPFHYEFNGGDHAGTRLLQSFTGNLPLTR